MPPNDSSTGGFLAPTSTVALVEDDALDDFLQTFVVGITSLPGNLVRARWQPIALDQPEPAVDWCAIGVTDETPYEGFGDQTHFGRDNSGGNPNGFSVTNEWSTVTVLASFYGPNARGNAALLRSGLAIAQNREPFYASGLALKEPPGAVRNATYEENEQTVRRYDLEIVLNRSITRVWPIDDLLYGQVVIGSGREDTQISITPDFPSSVDIWGNPIVWDPTKVLPGTK